MSGMGYRQTESTGSRRERSQLMQRWEEPRVVRLEALPQVIGACSVGSTAFGPCTTGSTYTQGACKVGAHASTKCETGARY